MGTRDRPAPTEVAIDTVDTTATMIEDHTSEATHKSQAIVKANVFLHIFLL